jgi:DNA primase
VDELEAIRAASDIVTLIAQYVSMRKSGVQFVGLCPFHQEKTPSFFVHPGKQVFRCHGCSAGGDVFQFVMDIEHVGFIEARKILASRCGIAVKPMTKSQRREYAITRELIEEAEYFGIREHLRKVERGMPVERYRQRCGADPDYRKWLLDDRKNAEEMTAALVAILVMSQEHEQAGLAA